MKRVFSMLLVFVLLFGMIPVVQAEEPQATVESNSTTVESTNSFGALLSEDIQQEQAAGEESSTGGYNVIGLTVENGIATVEYDTMEEAVLVVALYTEDGLQLLLSGNTVVQPDATEATITLEGTIPQYFIASAYLLDTYDYSPLCAAYETPMYTQEMQELLASTAEDYEADRVLQLGDDTTTNFAVYADSTKVVDYKDGVNTVVSADDSTATYVIENADESITGLKSGDVFAYSYGEEQILIVKVASISVSGTTATITGQDLEMEEVFTHVKLEAEGDASDVIVDESTAEEGVIYEGLSSDTPATRALDGETSLSKTLKYTLYNKKMSDEMGESEVSVTANGNVSLGMEIKFSYYISFTRQFIELKCTTSLKSSFSVTGKSSGIISLPSFKLPGFGAAVGFEPKLQLEVSGKVAFSLNTSFCVGFSYESGKGVQNLCTSPKTEPEFKVDGTVFLGVDLGPTVEVLNGAIAEATLELPIGLELEAELKGTWKEDTSPNAKSIHSCEQCVEMALSFKIELGLKLKFLKSKKLSYEKTFTAIKAKLGDLYWSIDNGEFGWGTCPYKSYRVAVQVKDGDGKNVSGVAVSADWTGHSLTIPIGSTNSSGATVTYLQAGDYTINATVSGEALSKAITVEDACKVVLDQTAASTPAFALGTVDTGALLDKTNISIVASGNCGVDGDNLIWTLYSNGYLTIRGTGNMKDYSSSNSTTRAPWYKHRNNIKTVLISSRVSNIGNLAFGSCTSLTSISIPDSVTSIGNSAFYGCSSLTIINIPDSVTSIGNTAFYDCTSLTSISIPDNVTSINNKVFYNCSNLSIVTMPDTITSIGEKAFYQCHALTSITVPDGVTSIGIYAFARCSSLTGINIPDGITIISNGTFSQCSSLIRVTIPDSVTTIGDSAFYCCEKMVRLKIGNNVTSIGDLAFLGCDSLTSVTIPDSVTTIGERAFYYSENLTRVNIGNNVTTIGEYAFYQCMKLTSINIPDSVTSINPYTFYYCPSLTDVTIGNSVTSIGDYAFCNCFNLTSIAIPDSVTSIGIYSFAACGNAGTLSVTIGKNVSSISNYAFKNCRGSITFDGLTPPLFGNATFSSASTTVYYPNTEAWTEAVRQKYGGKLTWVAYTPTASAAVASTAAITAEGEADEKLAAATASAKAAVRSVHGGEYGTEITDTYVLKTASFTDLVPGAQYVLLALISMDVDTPLAPDNLLYIDQAEAEDDGTLAFSYVQREEADTSYVMACGASDKNLQDAAISLPFMYADGTMQVIDPVVVYDGKALTEGVDYTIVGTVDYTEGGTYTCYIRGIYDYTGLVECTYTVASEKPQFAGVNVVLDAVLGVNFTAPAGFTAEITVGDAVQTVTSLDGVYTASIFAQDMLKPITAKLYSADGQLLDTEEFSLADYVSSIQGMEESTETKALATATLTYCQYAAKLKGNYSGELNALEAIPDNAFDAHPFPGGTAPGVSIHTYLEDACQLRMRVRSADYTVTVDGLEAEPIQDGSTWLYTTAPLLPQDYGEAHTFTVKQDGIELYSGSFSVLTYLGKCLESDLGTADQQNLMRAMYHYYAAAQAYQNAA